MAHEPAVFLSVTWSENCVLFPDGTRRPFDDMVRCSLTCGQLGARRKLLSDGAAEHALKHGAPRATRWRRHRVDLDPYTSRLAWFEDARGIRAKKPTHCDSVHLDCTPCAVYVNRVDHTQLALAFGAQLIIFKADSKSEACDWATVLASAIFFSSDSFKALIDECSRAFAIAISLRSKALHDNMHEGMDSQLSLDETAALLRAMFRPLSLSDVRILGERLAPSGRGLGVEAFTQLFRHMSSDDTPLDELARAITILSATHSKLAPPIDATPDLPLGEFMFEELTKHNMPSSIVNLLLDAADAVAYGASPEGPPCPVAPLQVAQVLYPRTAGLLADDHYVFDTALTPIGYRAEGMAVSPVGSAAPSEQEATPPNPRPDIGPSTPDELDAEIEAELEAIKAKRPPDQPEPQREESFVDQIRNAWKNFRSGFLESTEPQAAEQPAEQPTEEQENQKRGGGAGSDEKFFDSDEERAGGLDYGDRLARARLRKGGERRGVSDERFFDDEEDYGRDVAYDDRMDRARSRQGRKGGGRGSDERFFESDSDLDLDAPTPRTYASRLERARSGKAGDGVRGGSDETFFDSETDEIGPDVVAYNNRLGRARTGKAAKAGGGHNSEKFFDDSDEDFGPDGVTPLTYEERMERARARKAVRDGTSGSKAGRNSEKFFDDSESEVGTDGVTPRTYKTRLERARSKKAGEDRQSSERFFDDSESEKAGPDGVTPRTYKTRLERARSKKTVRGGRDGAERSSEKFFDSEEDAAEPATQGLAPQYETRMERARGGKAKVGISIRHRSSEKFFDSEDDELDRVPIIPEGGTLRSRFIGADLAAQAAARGRADFEGQASTPRTYIGRLERARARKISHRTKDVRISGASIADDSDDDALFVPVGATLRSKFIGEDLAAQANELRTDTRGPPTSTYDARVKRARAAGRGASEMSKQPTFGGTLRARYIAADLAERRSEPPITPRTYTGRIQRARAGVAARDLAMVAQALPDAPVTSAPEHIRLRSTFRLNLPPSLPTRVIGGAPGIGEPPDIDRI